MAGRGIPAKSFIVNEGEILTLEQIRGETVTVTDFAFRNTLECIQWLAKRRLIHNSLLCERCVLQMSFVHRGQLSDGYTWKCKECSKTVTIRKDSFFGSSHLSLKQILIVIYCWSRDFTQKNITYEARVGETTNHTIIEWCSSCREVCDRYLLNNPPVVGGLQEDGTSKIVEIDENKFFHRGQEREEHWVFGGIERNTGKCFLVELANRNTNTLMDIIQRYILPGSIIMSNGRGAYNRINQIGGGFYEHHVIIHQGNFVNPENRSVHTQTVENLWMRAKRKLRRQFWASEAVFTSYLQEFTWRNQFRNSNIFAEFLCCLREQYPV